MLRLAAIALTASQVVFAADVDFARDVAPVLAAKCRVCHQGDSAQKGLRTTSAAALLQGGESGPAVRPGDPENSLLLAKVSGDKPAMPPMGDPLTADEVDRLRRWIAAGAVDDSQGAGAEPESGWWSLQPFRDVPNASIDELVRRRLREKGLQASPPADRRTLIRRLKFDLLGLPPTPEEVDAFAADSDPRAYEKLVETYLADPAYGERWGRHWLDVARFGESNGYEQNHLRRNAWPYRDWVIRSFNEDKPFDRMILEQIAGDQIAPGDPEVEAATGFLVAGPHDTVGIKNPEGEAQKRANHLDDMIAGTASAFLGLTVHCARCHDHKFDPIAQKDYYRMQASLAGVLHGDREWDEAETIRAYEAAAAPLRRTVAEADQKLESIREASRERVEAIREQVFARYRPSVDAGGTEERFAPVEARFVRLRIERTTAGRNVVDLDELEIWAAGGAARNVAPAGAASAGSTRVDTASPDTYAARNLIDGKFDRRWVSGGGMPEWVQVELAEPVRIDRVSWSSDRLMGFQGRFSRSIPEEYAVEVSLDGETWNRVADSEGRLPYGEEARDELLLAEALSPEEQARRRAARDSKRAAERRLRALEEPKRAFLGKFVEPDEPSFVMVRGNPMDRGETVAPRSLSVLDSMLDGFELSETAPEGERRLALARWIASDRNALTARVIVNRVWMHHFGNPLVRTPSDFGVNGGEPTHPDLLETLSQRLVRDYDWRLKPLHREIVLSAAYRQGSAFREDAAAVDRDAAYLWRFPPRRLDAEEVRDAILAVSGALDPTMGGPGFQLYRYTVDNVATYYPLEEFGPETYRRSVYHQHARSVKPELLGQFDCPDSSLPAPKRVSTTTPLQALSLLNNVFLLDQARLFAQRSQADAGDDPRRRVIRSWRLAFGRSPREHELHEALRFAEENGFDLLARALFNANEFIYVF